MTSRYVDGTFADLCGTLIIRTISISMRARLPSDILTNSEIDSQQTLVDWIS